MEDLTSIGRGSDPAHAPCANTTRNTAGSTEQQVHSSARSTPATSTCAQSRSAAVRRHLALSVVNVDNDVPDVDRSVGHRGPRRYSTHVVSCRADAHACGLSYRWESDPRQT